MADDEVDRIDPTIDSIAHSHGDLRIVRAPRALARAVHFPTSVNTVPLRVLPAQSPHRAVLEDPPASEPLRIVARTSQGLVFLGIDEVLAFEAKDRLQFVHSPRGRFDLDVSLDELERALGDSFLRAHRNWLVSVSKVRKLETVQGVATLEVESTLEGVHSVLQVPVSKELRTVVRRRLLAGSIGLRRARAER
jgi:DNA-binding LytR/AlgR family response regulator